MKPRPDSAKPARRPAPGVVRGDTAYSLRALGRLTGLKEHGLRQLRAAGLPLTTLGREKWVLGEDFLGLIRKLRDRSERARSDSQTDGGEDSGR